MAIATRSGLLRTIEDELAAATRALTAALDTIEDAAIRRPDVRVLADAAPGCVRLAGLLATLAGSLGALAQTLVDGTPTEVPVTVVLADIAVDLATMRSLLHRATLVAAPALADLRQVPRPMA